MMERLAMGLYNKSTTSTDASEQTLFSFGIGTSDTNRANALEIKKNGDVYIGDKLLSDFATSKKVEYSQADTLSAEPNNVYIISSYGGDYHRFTVNFAFTDALYEEFTVVMKLFKFRWQPYRTYSSR